ncbi:MAG: ABC transporter substrate-binding protein, partial [Candidatus Bathyarchaeia archaeon]
GVTVTAPGVTVTETVAGPTVTKTVTPEVPVGLTGEVQLGFIGSMTGALATFGENELVAVEFAAEQVNEFLKASGEDWTVKIVVEDTQTDPAVCLEAVESLAARGIKLLIGPLSSAEVRNIKGYLDANKILTISQSSTAPDLAIPDDYVFRFCPTDKLGQGPALGRIMYDAGIRYVIPVWRGDAWGDGLEKAMAGRFEELGGTILEGIRYAPDAVEFSAEAADLASKVESAIASYGADQVAIDWIGFEEVNAFVTAAREYDVLWEIPWYGSDGTALSGAMLEDPAVVEFARAVGFYSTIFAPTKSAKFEMVRQNGIDKLGREPESYSYTAYDIVWAYAYALLAVDKYDAEAVKTVLPTVTESLFGASGWIELDEAGDRIAGDYNIWAITEVSPGVYDWKNVGVWVYMADSVTWLA